MILRTNEDKEYQEHFILNKMQIAAIENNQNPSDHQWIKIFYMILGAICLIIEISQRISVNFFSIQTDTDTYYHVPLINDYPTEFTASKTSIRWIWYVVYIWQVDSMDFCRERFE